jgi:hypothetical protein
VSLIVVIAEGVSEAVGSIHEAARLIVKRWGYNSSKAMSLDTGAGRLLLDGTQIGRITASGQVFLKAPPGWSDKNEWARGLEYPFELGSHAYYEATPIGLRGFLRGLQVIPGGKVAR